MPRVPRALEALVLALTLLTYGYAYDLETPTNARAHLAQTVSIVELGTLSINRFIEPPSPLIEWGFTGDWSRREEAWPSGAKAVYYYPAKAPGLSFLGVPIYVAARSVEKAAGEDPLTERVFWRNGRILAMALSALPAAIAAVLLLRLARALGATLEGAVLGALAIALGTCYSTFATVLYAHTPTAALLGAAAYFALTGEPGARRAGAAGLLVGLATLVTYQAAIAVPVLALVLGARARSFSAVLGFFAGGLPPLAAFAAIHAVEFGSPFATAYDFQNPDFTGGHEGGYFSMLGKLDAERLYELLFSPYRGMFFYSPVLLPAVAAAAIEARRGPRDRRLAALAALAILAAFLVVTGVHPVWWGGFTTGPRLLVPGFALLAPFAALAYERWPKTTAALGAISTAHAIASTFVSVSIVDTVRNPLLSTIYPTIGEGTFRQHNVRRNLAMALGVPPEYSLLPYLAAAGALGLAIRFVVRRAEAREEAAAS